MNRFLTGLFAWFGGLFAARPKTIAGTAAVLIAAAAFVGPWEGERTDMSLNVAQRALARQAYKLAGLPFLDGDGHPIAEDAKL